MKSERVEFITLDELKGDYPDLYASWLTDIERRRNQLWYRCPPGSVDKQGFPEADQLRVKHFCGTVLAETGKVFRAPKLPAYQDGAFLL